MKKANIILIAVSILAIAGGVLAFKTHKAEQGIYCSDEATAKGYCTKLMKGFTITKEGFLKGFCTETDTASCTIMVPIKRKKIE